MGSTFTASRLDAPLIRWFAPPALPTPDGTRQARVLWMVAWPFLAVVTVTLAVAVAVEPATLGRRAVTIVAVGALVALLHEVSRRGRTSLASWMFVLGLTLIVTQRAWNTGGIHAPVAVFYALFVVTAGALLGGRASLVTAALCLADSLFLTGAELIGWLPTPLGARPPLPSLVFVVLTLGVALVVQKLVQPPASKPDRLRDDLVNMFVHDMRSPITVLLAQLSMLREDTNGPLAGTVDEALGGARRLSRLATNLLDVSRLESGRMPVRRIPTDVALVARNVVSSMDALARDRRVEVIASSAVMCRCDPELVRRILENLVGNAIKHTPAEGKVCVHVAPLAGRVRVSVQDEGPGVPEPLRRRIFEKFGSPSLRTKSGYHSVGLGLAFCKLAVESHDGTIGIEDAVPRGSMFIVELPA